MVLPTDEAMLEALTRSDKPWEDLHHISYFFPDLDRIESEEFHIPFSECVDRPLNPLAKQGIYVEGNMANISEMVPINISRNPDVMENVFIGASCTPEEICLFMELFMEFCKMFPCSYEEVSGIDPDIVEHEIKTYLNAKHVCQKLHPVNPRKKQLLKMKFKCFLMQVLSTMYC